MAAKSEAVLIVGPGAVGGVLAARWAQAGREALLLGRSSSAESRLARDGLRFVGLDGISRRVRRGILSARRTPRRRLAAAFFCVKSRDTAAAIKSARRFIAAQTPVAGLENGLGHERLLRRAFGAKRTVIGSCYLAADRPAPSAFANSWGNRIELARTAKNAQALSALRRLLRGGGWQVSLAPSEDRMLWTKLCFNAATNPLGAICAVPNGELARDPVLKEIMLKVLAESVEAARKTGRRPLHPDMARLVVRACLAAPRQRNSMLQDLQAGRRTEIEAISRPILSAARRTKTPAPLLSRLSRLVRRLERRG